MSVGTERRGLEWLAEAAAADAVHTVRLSWPDRLGTLRGKRLPVDLFLASPERRISFCDGMIVVDVNCDVIQETPFSNFDTGYPDMYLRPRPQATVPVGWTEGEALVTGTLEDHGGEPLAVAPTNVLDRVLARLAEAGVELAVRLSLSGRLMRGRGEPLALLPGGLARSEQPPGILRLALDGLAATGIAVRSLETDRDGGFRLGLEWLAPAEAARQAVIAKAAFKELARAGGLDAVFMTVLPGGFGPNRLGAGLRVTGAAVEAGDLSRRLASLRALLQPSINAFKLGPPAPPAARGEGGDAVLSGLEAAAEADPATVLAAVGAAIGAGLGDAPAAAEPPEPAGLGAAAAILEDCGWAREWLGDEYLANTVPLLRSEDRLFGEAVTDWELDRYWSPG